MRNSALQTTANHHNLWSESFEFTIFDSLLLERFERGKTEISFKLLVGSMVVRKCWLSQIVFKNGSNESTKAMEFSWVRPSWVSKKVDYSV